MRVANNWINLESALTLTAPAPAPHAPPAQTPLRDNRARSFAKNRASEGENVTTVDCISVARGVGGARRGRFWRRGPAPAAAGSGGAGRRRGRLDPAPLRRCGIAIGYVVRRHDDIVVD
ncbi:hypothetical protein EVAR_25582_1 [Eumeta japonica]|uniref:Uncharacterized protein n=1 Tax=Eumeta variegata TaxID=151549 RepID=A0A4C1V0N6_EUMVA|nr:hypothetical protein EVAR_25582_1 [Eumeta japonica]